MFALLGGHGVFNGGYGIDVPDLMQYMAFIREAGEHVLIANRFDVVADPHLLLDPVFLLSGLLWRLGASIQFALLAWVPLSALALFLSFRAYVRRHLGVGWASAAALLLALFYLTPATALADWLHAGPVLRYGTRVVGLEMFPPGYAWSGAPGAAIALLPLCLLGSERLLRDGGGRLRLTGRAEARGGRTALVGAGGTLVSWIHPWQGLTLLVIWLALAVWGRLDRRYLSLAVPAAMTAAPLAYFFALSHTHSSWRTVSDARGYAHWGSWLLISLAPAVAAVAGYRGSARDAGERMLRLWPAAALIVYFALDRTWFYHAFIDVTLPLAILAVRGWRTLRLRRLLAPITVCAVVAPGLVWIGQQLVLTRPQHFFTAHEARALALLDRLRLPGPVLAPTMPLGQAVPAFTGRSTYTGHPIWTPGYAARTAYANALFDGRLSRDQAIALVGASRATFLLSDCAPARVDLRPVLGATIERTWKLGCATVYQVGGP